MTAHDCLQALDHLRAILREDLGLGNAGRDTELEADEEGADGRRGRVKDPSGKDKGLYSSSPSRQRVSKRVKWL